MGYAIRHRTEPPLGFPFVRIFAPYSLVPVACMDSYSDVRSFRDHDLVHPFPIGSAKRFG